MGNFLHDELLSTFPVDLDVDLVIVDYGVNDAIAEQFEFDTNNVKLAHEVFISHVRNDMIHTPALLYAESFLSAARLRAVPHQAGNMAEVHAAVTIKYDIPMVSVEVVGSCIGDGTGLVYFLHSHNAFQKELTPEETMLGCQEVSFRDAVWPHLNEPALANRLWGARVHPNWQVQQLLADVLVYFIQKSFARFLEEHGLLSNPSPHEEALSLFVSKMGCMADKRPFVLVAEDFVGLPPPEQQVESVGWSYSKDTRGESGLIGFGNSSHEAIVSFDLPCTGPRRVLDIGYLSSYIGMGAVKVVVRGSYTDPNDRPDKDKNSNDVVIDGLWGSKASVQRNELIPVPNGSDTIRVTFEVLSADTEASYTSFLMDAGGSKLDSVRQDRKFKILRMQCC